MSKDLSISIVSWNTCKLLDQCLASIYALDTVIDYEVIVVDNASSDGSPEMVSDKYPQVTLIRNLENIGFAGANNQAYERSSGRYFMLLNPDTVMHNGLDAVVDFMDADNRVAITGCRCMNPDGSIQPNWYDYYPSFFWEMQPKKLRQMVLSILFRRNPDRQFQTKWVGGQCMTVRRSVIDEIGIMDADYFMYSEETDWCFRAQKAGWQIWHFPGISVTHYGGQSTNQVSAAMMVELYRSKVKFIRKNLSSFQAVLFRNGLLIRTWLLKNWTRCIPGEGKSSRVENIVHLLKAIRSF